MRLTQRDRPLAIVATTPDDSHAWNLVGVQLKLEERGFQVRNLGPCTPSALLAEAIRDQRPDLVAISTINGHGAMSLPALLAELELYQVRRAAPIVVGGLLTDRQSVDDLRDEDWNVAGVFTGGDAWNRFDRFLARMREAEKHGKGPAFADPHS